MTIQLTAENRTVFGNKLTEARAEGKLPVVVYGPKETTGSYFVDAKDFKKVFKEAGESSVVALATPEGTKDTLIKEVAVHPVSGEPLHVDFYAVEKGKKVEVAIPLVFVGEAPAEKDLGGTLVKVAHEIEVEAMPKDLPHEIEVDVASLVDFEARILVKDLKLPSGVIAVTDGEEVVALVGAAGEEVAESDEAGDLASIEVEKKGKQDEEAAE
jgi:large subunit ribosomal protein L25